MADNVTLNPGLAGDTIAADEIAGVKHQRVKIQHGVEGAAVDASATDPLPVTGPLTDAQLRAAAVPVSGTVTASGPLTDAELRAASVPVSEADGANVTVGAKADVAWDGAAAAPTSMSIWKYIGQKIEAVRLLLAGVLNVNVNNAVALDSAALTALETITVASVTAPLAAGDNNIGNVDVASSALPSGAATSAAQDTGNTALAAIQTAVEALDNAVAGTELQVDVIAPLPAGTNNIGDVDIASALPAGDNNIGNVDVVAPLSAVEAGPTVIGALDAAASLAIEGRPFVGITLTDSQAMDAVLVVEFLTAANVWDSRYFFNGDSWVTGDKLPNTNGITVRTYSVPAHPSDTQVRVRVLTYTSGSVSVTLRACATADAVLMAGLTLFRAVPTTLGALNAEVSVPVLGQSLGFAIEAGTLAGTLVIEASTNNEDSWDATGLLFFDGANWVTSVVLTNPNSAKQFNALLGAAYTNVRLRVSAYTSGSCLGHAQSSPAFDAIAPLAHSAAHSLAVPTFSTAIAGRDVLTHRALTAKIVDPAATDTGLVTRNLPLRAATSTNPAQTAVGTSVVTLLAANASRKRFRVENTGTTVIFLSLGTTDPSGTAYHVALKACTGANDGTGGTYTDELWTGAVEAIGSGAGGTVVVTELT